MHTYGQNPIKNYSHEWKIANELIGKGLSKDALEQVKKIYQLAKKEKQDAQVIKAAVHMVQLQNENREGNAVISIAELEEEMAESTGPAKAIFTSLVASQYYSYYQTVRWQLYNRTATANFNKTDIATWGTEDFHHKIGALFLESISDEALLKKTRLEPYDAIITAGNTRKLRPTLYDMLTFKALQYFSSDERNIKKPAYAFEINTASAFDPAADFIHRKFETKDSASLEYHALLLYQKLIAFHLNDAAPDALIDVDLQRIQYVKQKSVHPDKDGLYFMSINHVAEQYQSTPAAAQAWFLKAQWFNQQGDNYNTNKDSAYQFEHVKAVEICQKVIRENPETEGGINAYNLLQRIKAPSLHFSAEHVNVPDKPFLALVKYKNVGKLYLRLIKATEYIRKNLEENATQSKWNLLTNSQPVRAWEQALPDTKDYQQHSVEIKVDGLPVGEYVLLAATNADFKGSKTLIGARLMYVSNISFVQKERDFFILNRDSGQPLAGANVTLWDRSYDYSTRRYGWKKGQAFVTDRNGYFKGPPVGKIYQQNQTLLEINFQNERLFVQEPNSTFYYIEENEEEELKELIYLFTDRSLYRPGQTVYYKGIARKGKTVLKDQKKEITVELHNANGEKVQSNKHFVNEYGSLSGSFNLPENGLTGNFRLQVRDEYRADFYVEEYKRPKFAAEFDTLKATYKLNDTIVTSGTATAYAGNAIDGATVRYRVVRTPRIIYTWMLRRWWDPSPPMEIAHGETVTDASGKFKVTFTAIPDLKTDQKMDPVFDYSIHADITDSNGETRSAETRISVSNKSYILRTQLPEKTETDSLKSLNIRTENLAGVFSAARASIKITRLLPEKRLIRNRYWQRPDLFVMTKADFIANFPHDEYDEETEMANWQESGVPMQKEAELADGASVGIQELRFDPGFYKIVVKTINAAGEEVTDIKYIELTDPKSQKLVRPEYLSTQSFNNIEPGEKGKLVLATSADNAFLISHTNRKSANKGFSFLTLNNEIRKIDFDATEQDRGGYAVSYLFVKHNRVHQHTETVNVPWTNKDLHIEYGTFRDKTLPGSKEIWKVKISGYKKEKVAAEMLASMYDASLDQFHFHQWQRPYWWRAQAALKSWISDQNFGFGDSDVKYVGFENYKSFDKSYDELIGSYYFTGISRRRDGMSIRGNVTTKGEMGGMAAIPQSAPMVANEELKDEAIDEKSVEFNSRPQITKVDLTPENAPAAPTIRTNFNETAFFLPNLQTDSEGNITFSFTMPEALTKWKFQALAHTKDLAVGYSSREIVTQKELMVQPNAPRFLREGDKISFPVKVVNLTDRELKGSVTLHLKDTESNEDLNAAFGHVTPEKQFIIQAKQSTTVVFAIQIPKNFTKTITWTAIAKAGNLSDGEENILPVLPNRMLVTESMPVSMRGNGSKNFTFEKLLASGKSATLAHQSLTVEYTSNPAWYAIQALPYLMEYPYECAEQTWNRYYANALATSIVRSSPRIAKVFETWKSSDTTALQSNLAKNQELKSLLLTETPWVLTAKTEAQQKQNIAMLFNLVRMSRELDASLRKLQEMQSPNGGFVWFKGGPDDRYMTQYIITGIGHLKKMNALPADQQNMLEAILAKAIPYLDKRIEEDYKQLIKWKSDLAKYTPGPLELHYLYMRSFYPEKPVPQASQKAYQYYRERAFATWTSQAKMLQGLIALTANRANDTKTAKQILESLRQTAIRNEELGMYWKSNQRGWWWHEAPTERQALLIEAFQEISNDASTVNDLKTWLLKNKQTNNWESTKATAEACYALLLQGNYWLTESPAITINLGKTEIKPADQQAESGTGYFKKTLNAQTLSPDMGNVRVSVAASVGAKEMPNWGAVYWQYFEDLDKITFAETPLKLVKKLFIEKNTDTGPVLTPINEGDAVHIGDKIKVRIELRVDRDMEYVHMKDMRASALEPVNVLSGYRWQGGLGYYESTRDASTNFFFNTLQKGTYVFEYPLFVTHEGDFSNGITTIQCMYAPEFTAHSEGVRLKAVSK
jgi:uncharacterized protein YfaS (alpha-2-macroglobulin family)